MFSVKIIYDVQCFKNNESVLNIQVFDKDNGLFCTTFSLQGLAPI